MEQYIVTGMTCAACQARVEKAVNKVPGVESCSVSLLTNSMGVEGSAKSADVIKAVVDAGYGASLKKGKSGKHKNGATNAGAAQSGVTKTSTIQNGTTQTESTYPDYAEQEEMLKDHETPKLKKRLLCSLGFWLVLMYFSMGHMLWGWPLPSFFNGNHVAMGLLQLILTAIIMVINQRFFVSGFKSLFKGVPNMDTLVALGAGAAFAYSTVALFAMTGAQVAGDAEQIMHYMDEFYFESAATILTLITVGKMLEARSKGKTTDALKSLLKLAPKTAVLLIDGQECEAPIDDVKIGDIFIVKPGDNIPVDGIVKEGYSAVDESALSGESIPVDKNVGDKVSAATLNQSGFLKCEATRVGEDTTFSQIIQMVSDAAATKAPIAKIADRVSGVFVPTVICLAILTFIVWLCIGNGLGYALARGISVLVISCPCALGLATPVAIMVGSGVGAKNGIMFKTAVSLEETGKTDVLVLDKTGTITLGQPKVTDIVAAKSVGEKELLAVAYSLEQYSEHPLAKAIIEYANEQESDGDKTLAEHGKGIVNNATKPLYTVTDFQALSGNGVRARISCNAVNTDEKNTSPLNAYAGNKKFIEQYITIDANILSQAEALADEGKTPLFFATEEQFLGMIAVADVLKEDSAKAISEIKNMGIHVVMLTGDNEKTANAIGKFSGVDEVIAGVLPDGKEACVRAYKEKGKVTMVGDGINDAPALAIADMGIAIGAGTDVAIDAADVVLLKSKLSDVAAAIRLSRATLKNIHQNLFWAFFYNMIGIPLAAGVFIPLFHWELNPMFGAAAMSLSSFCVVTNALRLNLCRVYDAKHDKIRGRKPQISELSKDINPNDNNNLKEDTRMTKTLKVEGMMCEHCEARVKKVMEQFDQVDVAVADHNTNTVTLTLNADIEEAVLKEAIEAQDYKYLGME